MHKLRAKLYVLWGEVEERKRDGQLGDGSHVPNLPFTCCIQEYGVEDGRGGYVRMHRIFDTTIHSD
jgi:hypothetical protein